MRTIRKEENVLIVVSGVSGSGKSTISKKISENGGGIKIVNMDNIREEMTGDASNQTMNDEVFKEMCKRIRKELSKKNSVIVDNTSVSSKDRKTYLKFFDGLFSESYLIFVDTDIETCKKRNSLRERVVPEYAIDKQFKRLEYPKETENFTYIEIIHNS